MVAIAPLVAPSGGLSIPVYYHTFESQQILANISWGTPPSEPITTVVDTGSYGLWVFGPNATVNSGSPYLGVLGSCNDTAKPYFDWPDSTTHADLRDARATFAYGGNGKIIQCPVSVNDTMSFPGFPSIENVQVSACEFMLIKDRSTTCSGAHYDKSILGLSPMKPGANSPVFRTNLKDQGRLDHSIYSIWFDQVPADINEAHRGVLYFGEAPSDKHVGELATLNNTKADEGFYYVTLPEIQASRIGGEASTPKTIPAVTPSSGAIPDCLVDSGAWGITLPNNETEFFAATGLEPDSPFIRPRYPTTCDKIPYNETLDIVFTGADGKSATVKVPYRDLAQGPGTVPGTCGLGITLSDPGCTLGGTFFASAFTVFDDENRTIQVAQGAAAARGPSSQ